MPKPLLSTKPVANKLKIGLVLDDTLDSADGVQQYLLTIGQWFTQQGHDVHYLVGATRRQDIPQLHSLSRNLKVRFNGNYMSMPLPANKRRLRRLLQSENFDVLHVQMPYSPFLAGRILAAAPEKTAIVGTFHIAPYSRFVTAANRLLFWMIRGSLRRFDDIVSVSPVAQRFARQTFGIKSEVVPNAVNLEPYRQAKSLAQYDDMPTIVFLGRLMERKGAKYLLQAVDHIHSHNLAAKPYQVVICGKGPLQAQLQEYVQAHRLDKIVTFAGFVPEEEKPRYLASSDIAIFPSTAGESFGIVLVEAMAASRGAVLAGDNPGYASVMQAFSDNLCDPHDTKQLAEKLAALLEDAKQRQQLSNKQKMAAEQYDVSQVGRRLLNHYRTALHRRQR